MNLPPCPMCGHNRNAVYRGPGDYYCKTHGLYDDSPDEGGTHDDINPARRLERAEQRRQRHRN